MSRTVVATSKVGPQLRVIGPGSRPSGVTAPRCARERAARRPRLRSARTPKLSARGVRSSREGRARVARFRLTRPNPRGAAPMGRNGVRVWYARHRPRHRPPRPRRRRGRDTAGTEESRRRARGGRLLRGPSGCNGRRGIALSDAPHCPAAQVARTTVLLADIADYPRVNAIYGESWFPRRPRLASCPHARPRLHCAAFRKEPPARAAFQVAALPAGGRVEITCVALASA